MTPDRPRSLVWATDLDVLSPDRVIERRDSHWVVRTPSNPGFYWGNLVIFDEPPRRGDGPRWEALFAAALPGCAHTTLAWDRTDGETGEAAAEFASRGYEIERAVGLVARIEELHQHPRENRDVTIRALSSQPGADRAGWEQVLEIWLAEREPHVAAEAFRTYALRRLDGLRALFRAGQGSWYVALAGEQVVASCGIVVTGGRARFQAVDTIESERRRGICSRLVVEAARDAAARFAVSAYVIAADPAYHALGLYESLGFVRRESVSGVLRVPPVDVAAA